MGRAGRGIPIASAGVPETHFMCLRATHCLNAPNSCEYLLFNDPSCLMSDSAARPFLTPSSNLAFTCSHTESFLFDVPVNWCSKDNRV